MDAGTASLAMGAVRPLVKEKQSKEKQGNEHLPRWCRRASLVMEAGRSEVQPPLMKPQAQSEVIVTIRDLHATLEEGDGRAPGDETLGVIETSADDDDDAQILQEFRRTSQKFGRASLAMETSRSVVQQAVRHNEVLSRHAISEEANGRVPVDAQMLQEFKRASQEFRRVSLVMKAGRSVVDNEQPPPLTKPQSEVIITIRGLHAITEEADGRAREDRTLGTIGKSADDVQMPRTATAAQFAENRLRLAQTYGLVPGLRVTTGRGPANAADCKDRASSALHTHARWARHSESEGRERGWRRRSE